MSRNLIEQWRSGSTQKRNFNKWVRPKESDLKHEYKVEYEIKPLKRMLNDPWPTVSDFLESARKAKIVEITPSMDRRIAYRSRTDSKESLIGLISSYRSYPEFRNEKTVQAIYDAFENNTPMTTPIVLEMPDGSMRVMGGNTRMDIAFQMGVNPKVLLIKVPS